MNSRIYRKIYPYIILFLWLLVICFQIIGIYQKALLKKENEILLKDNERLELDLAAKENEFYDLSLELKTTEKALSDVVNKLEKAEESNKEILHYDYVGEFNCTAYCVEKYSHICGTGSGKTASGAPVTADVSVAVGDLEMFPYGTILYIEDVGIRIVQDTGSFDPTKIDVAVDTHKHAKNWEGQGKHKVWIVEEVK